MKFYSILHLLIGFSICSSYLINVKIVKETTTSRYDFTNGLNNREFKSAKTHASNFSGPSDLEHLLGKCFLYSNDKYNYRVCPFDNVTQHEKLWQGFNGYNGIIGIWKEWKIINNSFDSLMYYSGDDCGEELERNAEMKLICGEDNRVVSISEPNKCHYEIAFASDFACGEKYIYPHLKQEHRDKWDVIETNYFYGELTKLGYETALNELFVETGIVLNKTILNENNKFNFENKEQCFEKVVLLEKENSDLKQRIKLLENSINKV